MKEYFDKKIADLKRDIDEGILSNDDLAKKYNDLMASMEFNSKVGLVDSNDLGELTNKMDDCKQLIGISDEVENIVDVDDEASKNKNGKKTALKVAAGVGAVALAAGGIAALASSCENQDTNEDQLKDENANQTQDTTAIDVVNNKLSTFVNDCLNNGVDLTTDEALMLMYASNIETRIDVGDNMTLDQVVIAHYIDLAENLIANDSSYKYYSVSDVVAELMTNDYHNSLAKINDAFIKYGYIVPTSSLIANENDSKVLADFEQSLRDGISKNGNFTEANKLAKEAFDKDSVVLSGTRIIIAGQYSAINAYGQNAGVKISGMDQKAFDAIFRECGGGNVKDVEYEAYTSYMTLLRATFAMDVERQIISWDAVVASNENSEVLASEKYEEIDKYINTNKVELATPENVNKERVEKLEQQMESDNKKAQASLKDKLNNGAQLVTDSKGNQTLIVDKVTEAEKEAIKNKDKEKAEANSKVELDKGFTQDKDGNVVDKDGNNLGKPSVGTKPIPNAPVMTPDEIKDKENAAADLLKPENNIVKEEFTPVDEVVVGETVTEFINGISNNVQNNVTEQETNNNSNIQSTIKDTIKDLEDMKEQLNNSINNNSNNSPIQDEVTYELEEGWMIDDNGNATLAPGYTFDTSGNVVKVNVK